MVKVVASRSISLEIEGREVVISHPDKVFFARTGHTKLDLVNYYLAVAGRDSGGRRAAYGDEAVRQWG